MKSASSSKELSAIIHIIVAGLVAVGTKYLAHTDLKTAILFGIGSIFTSVIAFFQGTSPTFDDVSKTG